MKTSKAKSRVTFVEVGRLYNLGNYQNVSYKLGAQVEPGDSAAKILQNLVRILKAANPKSPVSEYDLQNAYKRLEKPEDLAKNMTNAKERKKAIRQMVKDAKAVIAQHECSVARRNAALKLIDDIGGTVVHKDAKDSWRDDDDF